MLNYALSFVPEPHVDGFHPAQNGVPGSIRPFTAIAGFFLNDLDHDWCGNFTVWPGSHKLLENYFRNNKPDPDLKNGIPPGETPGTNPTEGESR